MKKSTAITYTFLLGVIAIIFSVLLWRGNWLETDLKALLPTEQKWTAQQVRADQIQEAQLNRQVVFLVGSQEPAKAFQVADELAEKLRTSGLFSKVFAKNEPDLTSLQAEIQQLKWAVLPEKERLALLENPQGYFQTLAESIANPFGERNLLPLEQDWLGLGRFAVSSGLALSKVRWDANTGSVFVESEGKTWSLIRAELAAGDLINPQANLLFEIQQAREFVAEHQAELLVTGSAVFGAIAKQAAEKESVLMSVLGISCTLLLLIWVFRSFKALWLFLPIGIGLIAGITATVLCFGQIHILTLVVGTSLVGVLIDFPLHWLAGSRFDKNWHGKQAMQALKPTFTISLIVTLLGYGLLIFTCLPVLKQTAVFSATALIIAMGATICYLPNLIAQSPCVSVTKEQAKIKRTIKTNRYLPMFAVMLLTVMGIYQSQWQDDIRQWVALPDKELKEAALIGKLTGIDLSTQYFLVIAENDEQLLERNRQLSQRLQSKGIHHQALSQWLTSEQSQKQTALQLISRIQPLDYAALNELGIPNESVQNALTELHNQPTVSLRQALNTTIGQGWRTLYLGELGQGSVGSVVKIQNMTQTMNLAEFADNQGVFWQDKRSNLNENFQITRNQAAWLKLISFALALLLLWQRFGIKTALSILIIPLTAIVITVGVLGWLALPITLFAMFGLLLVSAIGIDYAAYMVTARESIYVKRFAVSLAAVTTMISFILLALSSTPAVASFGISVSTGVLFSLLLTLFYSKNQEQTNANKF